jgi:deoxyribose-phosphate aldolase
MIWGERIIRFEQGAGEGRAPAEAARDLVGAAAEIDGVRVSVTVMSATEARVEAEIDASAADGDVGGARARLVAVVDNTARRLAAVERATGPAPPPGTDMTSPAAELADLTERAQGLFSVIPAGADRVDDLRLAVVCIDLTTLEGDDTRGRVRALCAQAVRPDPCDASVGPVAAVCLYPSLIPLAVELTAGTGVAVASVAGAFPSGLSAPGVKLADIESALAAGANEIDIVLDRSAFLDGRLGEAADEVAAARAATAAAGAHLKVILEVGELGTPAAITAAARLAMDAGADFIKTSTGKAKTSATPETVLVMAEAIAAHEAETGRAVGLKVAGGVRTADQALGYLSIVRSVLGEAWLTPERFRFGASGLLGSLLTDLAAAELAGP